MDQPKKLDKALKLSLLLLTAFLVVGCGKSSPEVPPEAPAPTPTPSPTPTAKPYARCNQGNSSSYQLNVKAFVDSSKTVRMDWAIGKVLHLPTTFSSDGSFISFFRWKTDSSGQSSIDNTALPFQLQKLADKSVIIHTANKISWSDVSAAAAGMTASDFFSTARFVIYTGDTEGQYSAIKMVIYKSDSSVAEQIDILLPVFDADPDNYAMTSSGSARSTVLTGLHPFRDLSNQGISSSQFQNMADGFCF